MATKKALATEASAEALAALAAMAPQADTYNKTTFPKITFKSQTVLDDDENVVIKAGTFFTEKPTDEEDEDGKKIWEKKELGKSLDGHIIYHRTKLSFWNDEEQAFYSTPMYDLATDIVPLFKSGEFVADGTPDALKAMYRIDIPYKDKKTGEDKTFPGSLLREARVLYVLLNGELFELTVTGTSMRSFENYRKKFAVPATITTFNSTKEEKGSTKWNCMSFKATRNPSQEEAELALATQKELVEAIENEKEFYAAKRVANTDTTTPAPAELPAGEEGEDDF